MKVMQRQRLECCSHKPSKARGHQKLEEARDRIFQEPLEGGRPCRHLDCEQRHFCCLKPPAAAAAKSLQSCQTLCDPKQPTRLPRPWDSQGKSTGVGCHFLLQCMKVKSESEVAQSCLTLSDPMDCSLPGSCVHGIFQARVLEWGAIVFSA